MLLGTATIVTILVLGIVAAFASVLCSMGYMSMVVHMAQPADFFAATFLDRIGWSVGLSAAIVISTALHKYIQLSQDSGRTLARLLGWTRVAEPASDAGEKRLLNVVEELAIAAGVRSPAVYVLRDESGINAFAAGTRDKEYVIGVTQGAVERLSREQLQGVVAHELSHIVNLDTRINVQLLGARAGLHALSFCTSYLISMGTGRHRRGGAALGGNGLG